MVYLLAMAMMIVYWSSFQFNTHQNVTGKIFELWPFKVYLPISIQFIIKWIIHSRISLDFAMEEMSHGNIVEFNTDTRNPFGKLILGGSIEEN